MSFGSKGSTINMLLCVYCSHYIWNLNMFKTCDQKLDRGHTVHHYKTDTFLVWKTDTFLVWMPKTVETKAKAKHFVYNISDGSRVKLLPMQPSLAQLKNATHYASQKHLGIWKKHLLYFWWWRGLFQAYIVQNRAWTRKFWSHYC